MTCVHCYTAPHAKRRDCYRTPWSARVINRELTKGYLKPSKWTAETFRTDGAGMIEALARTAKVVQRYAWPTIVREARRVMDRQLERAIAHATSGHRAAGSWDAKIGIEVAVSPADANLWLEALNEAFAETGADLVAELVQPIQSVGAQGYAKTSEILGVTPDPRIASGRGMDPHRIAARITGIDDTTRERFRRIIVREIDDGATPARLAATLRREFNGWPARRLATIARTETSNAWTWGSVEAMKEVPNLISVDVIGCESREMERWNQPSFQQFMYQGEGTCNIEGVSIRDAHLLNFHPNHTGVIVPSEFRDEQGNVTLADR